MGKLLTKFIAAEGAAKVKAAVAIRAYDRKHMMASCMMSPSDQNLLAAAISLANREG